jgi:glucose-fructose oxidoreductase
MVGTRGYQTMPDKHPVRYAVLGLGHIAQVAVLPAFEHAKEDAVLTALVSDDPEKLSALRSRYTVPHAFTYEQMDECLKLVDAVYIALPNSLHADYAVRAANAGVHVLCEKPMAVTVDECERMIQAAREHDVRLMVAYRLHFEHVNLRAIALLEDGAIGEPKVFNSTFSMRVRPGDIRTNRELGGGTLYDLGVYCINAARYLFRAEPKEVQACSVNGDPDRLPDVDETTAGILRFDGESVASFVTSFNAADAGWYEVLGTTGRLKVEPAYEYAEGLAYEITVKGRTTKRQTAKRDQFAAELIYFARCIQDHTEPEPSGEEGLQDVRIVTALYESAETGKPVQLPPYEPRKRPDPEQEIRRPSVEEPQTIKARAPHL